MGTCREGVSLSVFFQSYPSGSTCSVNMFFTLQGCFAVKQLAMFLYLFTVLQQGTVHYKRVHLYLTKTRKFKHNTLQDYPIK